MQYEKYQKKVAKIAKFLGTVRRFRVLIITVLSIAVASTVSYMAFGGMVYDDVPCPTSVQYGEDVGYEAKAVFKNIRYEYAPVSNPNAWSAEQPTVPGEYLVRAVSKSVFGSPRYGDAHAYKILPRAVSVKVSESELLYGSTPTVTADLPYSDTAYCTDFVYEDISLKETSVTPVLSSIVIKDKDGRDVTSYYEIKPEEREISILPLDLTVTVSSSSKTYNGIPLSFDAYEITSGTPVKGNQLYATITSSITDAGTKDNEVSEWLIVDADGNNVTAHYKITEIKGKLTVKKRAIVIQTDGASFVYDGTDKSNSVYSLVTGDEGGATLVRGHEINVTAYATIKNVGTEKNTIAFEIIDAEGEDVSGNYSVFVDAGILEVTKRVISVSTESAEREYDGTPLSSEIYEIDADTPVADGHSHSLVSVPSLTEVLYLEDGSISAVINQPELLIVDADGEDVTANYELDFGENSENLGRITVKPREITVTTGTKVFTYDGKSHQNILEGDGFNITLGDMADGESLFPVSKGSASVSLVSDGETDNYIEFLILDSEGNKISAGNYNITEILGKISVSPLELTAETGSRVFEYDGTDHSYFEENTGYLLTSALPEGHSIEVGSYETVNTATPTPAENRIKLVLKHGDETVAEENYNITYTYGTLTVTPRPITLASHGAEKVYDGTSLTESGYDTENLVDGHTVSSVSILPEEELIAVGSTANLISGAVIVDADGNDVSSSYAPAYVFGTLTVSKRPIRVKSADASWVYDGAAHSDGAFSVIDADGSLLYELAAGHTAEVSSLTLITNEWEDCQNDILITVKDAGGAPVTDNYDIDYVAGSLEITKRAISVTTHLGVWTYDAKPHTNTGEGVENGGYTIGGDGLGDYLIFEVTESAEITSVGEISNEIDGIIRLASDNSEVDVRNYEIGYVSDKLRVTKRHITVTTDSNLWVYDGEEHSDSGFEVLDDPDNPDDYLAEGHEAFALENTATVVNVKDTCQNNNIFAITVVDSEITENYEITYIYGTLTVNPRPISIITESGTWVYDGDEHSLVEYRYADGSLELVLDHEIVFTDDYTRVTNHTPEPISNVLTVKGIYDGEGVDVSDNYVIPTYDNGALSYGTLSVTKRAISIVTKDGRWRYDGKEHTLPEYDYAEGSPTLVLDHEIVFDEPYTSVKDYTPEPVPNVLTVKGIYDGEGVDVSDNYVIPTYDNGALGYGTLEITKRAIVAQSGSASFTYDGVGHYCFDFEVLEGDGINHFGLAEGHTAKLDWCSEITNVWESGDNLFEIVVEDENGEDVTESYERSYLYGTLTITVRRLTLTSGSAEFVYDGVAHTHKSYTIGGAGLGDYLYEEVSELQSFTDTWDSGDNVIKIKLYLKDGDVEVDEENYEVEYTYNKVTVKPRPVYVVTDSNEWVYDGKEHSDSGFEVVDNPDVDCDGLVLDHSVILFGDPVTVKYVADTEEENNKLILIVQDETVNKNYEIHYTYGTLTVKKRPIKVTLGTSEWTYDGKEHSDTSSTVEDLQDVEDGLADGERVVPVQPVPTIKNVGWVDNIFEITIKAGEEDTYDNYEVTVIGGKLTVTPRKITVIISSDTWTYDALWHSNPGFTVVDDPDNPDDYYAPGEEGFAPEVIPTIVNVGSIDNIFDIIIMSGETVTTDNYEITTRKGTLKVNQRIITVKTYDGSWIYDALEHFNTGLGIENGGYIPINVVPTLYPEMTPITKITDVGEISNEVKVEIFYYEGETRTRVDESNCKVVYDDWGTLKIIQRVIEITTHDGSWIYDAMEHFNTGLNEENGGYTAGGDGLVPTLHPSMTPMTSVTNVFDGKVQNEIRVEIFYYEGETLTKVLESNCKVEYVQWGTLEIIQRIIEITTHDGKWVYDGTAHSNTGLDEENGGYIAGGDGLVPTLFPKMTPLTSATNVSDTGTENKITVEIFLDEAFGTPVDERNCKVTYDEEYGIFTILVRRLIVVTLDGSWQYDGEPHSNTGWGVENGGFVYDISDPEYQDHCDTLFEGITEATSVTNVWDSGTENIIKIKLYLDEELTREVDPENYEVSYDENYGILTVTKRTFTIEADSAEKLYDGTPLTKDSCMIDGLVDGHAVVDVTVKGEQTQVGSSPNKASGGRVIDAEGNDVTDNYEPIYEDGTLTVKENPDMPEPEPDVPDDDDDSDKVNFDTSGSLGGSGVGGKGDKEKVVMTLRSTATGKIYMRIMSYGSYNPATNEWESAPSYSKHLTDSLNKSYSYNYLAGRVLENAGRTEQTLEVMLYSDQYMLPYYLAIYDNGYVPTSDVAFGRTETDSYTVKYYAYDGTGIGLVGIEDENELAYRQYVYDNYRYVDDETKAYILENVIAKQGFSADDVNILEKVKAYLQNPFNFTYNMNYPEEADTADNPIIAFFEIKEGVCRHYASAATMIFRTLGIPARYTVGCVGSTKAGEWTEITADKGHAWCEVYLDGIGWVMLEVTGGGSASDDLEGDLIGNIGNMKDKLVIRPVSVHKNYDGEILYAENALDESSFSLAELLAMGYYYDTELLRVEGATASAEPGTASCNVVEETFRLYDPSGNDVTDQFNIVFEPGTLTIHPKDSIRLDVTLDEVIYTYSGEEYTYDGDEFDPNVLGLPEGYTKFELEIRGSLVDAGSLKYEDIGYTVTLIDADGNDLSDRVYVVFSGTPLSVRKATLTVTTSSATREYEAGNPLRSEAVDVSMSGELADGHYVKAEACGEITDVGVAFNELKYLYVFDGEDRDVTENFEITIIFGVLEVTE